MGVVLSSVGVSGRGSPKNAQSTGTGARTGGGVRLLSDRMLAAPGDAEAELRL
jgi:hypothetical protein